jgi:hypothetical protein
VLFDVRDINLVLAVGAVDYKRWFKIMNKTKRRINISLILVAFIAILAMMLTLMFKSPSTTELEQNNNKNVAEAATTFDGTAQSFMPGQVISGYQPVAGSTAISNADGMHNLRDVGNNEARTGNFHLTQNITMGRNFAPLWIQNSNNNSWNGYDGKDYWGNRFFDGVLDGCGYTVTFQYDTYDAWGRTTKDDSWFAAGLIVGILRGTIKNLNVRIEGTTACFSDYASGDGTGFGVIASKAMDSGLVDNCTVTIASGMYLRFHCTRNRASSMGGFLGIAEGNSQVKNSKFIVESGAKFELNNNSSESTGTSYDSSIGGIIGEVRDSSARTVVENCYLSGSGTIKGNVNNGSADVFVGGAIGVVEGGAATKVNGFYYDFTGRLESMEGSGGGSIYYTPNGHRIARNAYVSNVFYRNDYGTSDGITQWTNNDGTYVSTTPVQVRREAFYNNYNGVTTDVNNARIDSIYFNKSNINNVYVVTHYSANFNGNIETVVGQIGNNENTSGDTGRIFDPNKPGVLDGLCFMRNATNKWHYTDTTKSTFTSTGKMNVVYRQGKLGKVGDTGSVANKTFTFDGNQKGSDVVNYFTNYLQIQDSVNNSMESADLNVNNHGVGGWQGRNPDDSTAKGFGASVQIKNLSNQIVYESSSGTYSNGGMIKPGTYTAILRPSSTQQYMCGFVVMALKNSYATNATYTGNPFIAVSEDVNPLPTITFTVAKKNVDVLAPSGLQHTYGDNAVSMTPTYSGLVTGYNLTGSLGCDTTLNNATPVGDYPITIGTITDPNGVYNLNFTSKNYKVVARNLTLQASQIAQISKVYGEADNLASSVSTGYNGDTLAVLYTRSTGDTVGTYNLLTAAKNEANNNYGNITIAANGGLEKFEIGKKNIADVDITVTGIVSKTYSGSQLSQTFSIYWGEDLITDYTVSYATGYNVEVSTGGRIVITGTGNFSGTRVETYTITPLDISTLTFTPIQGGAYTGSAYTPVSAVTFGSTTLTSGTDYVNSYLNNTEAGEATLVITGQGNFGSVKNITFTISKAELTYNWTNSETYTYTRMGQGATVSISGLKGAHTVSQGFSVVYTGNTYAGVAYNSIELPTEASSEYTATVTIIGGTEYSNNYQVPANAAVTFSIDKADIGGVYFEGTTVVYNGQVRYLNVSNINQPVVATSQNVSIDIVPASAINNTGDQANIVYAGNGVTGISVEGVQITATLSSTNYNNKVMVATLIVQRANSIIDVTNVEKNYTYNGNEQVVKTGATLNHSEAELVYSNNKFTNVPATLRQEVTVSVPQTAHYNAASVSFSIAIAKAKYNVSGITFTDAQFTYDGNQKTVVIAGTLPSGLAVEYENNKQIVVGEYMATAKFIGDEVNYEMVANKLARLVIIKAYYNVSGLTFEDKTVDYNGQVQKILVNGILPNGLTVEYVNNDNENAGTYVIAARFNGDYDNYHQVEEMQATLNINKLTYDMSGVQFVNQTKTYNKQSQSAQITGTLPVGIDGIPVTVSYAGNITNVGNREITAMFNSTSINYILPVSELTATLTIAPAVLIVEPADVYTVSAPHVNRPINLVRDEHYTIRGLFTGDNVTIANTAEYASTEIGQTTIYMKLLSVNNSNYTVGDGTVIVNLYCEIVDSVQIVITGTSFTFTGLGITPEVFVGVGNTRYEEYTVQYFDIVSSEEIGDLPVNVGEYKIVVNYDDDLDSKTAEQNFTIEKANVELLLDSNIPGVYGRFARHTATAYGLLTDSFRAPATVSYSYAGRHPAVGIHKATINFEGSQNYLPSSTQVDFEIVPQNIIVRVIGGGSPIVYDGKTHTFTFEYSSLAAGDKGFATVDFGDGESSKKDVGAYEGVVTANNPNYNVVRVEGNTTLTINPKRLTVTVFTEDEGIENEEINWEIEYEGFIDGEYVNALTKKPFVAKNKFDPGLYQVSAEGGVAKNYQFKYVPFALRVYANEIVASNNTTNIKVEGSFGPEAYLHISDLGIEEDATSAIFNASNMILKAYKVEVKDDDKNQTYKVKFVDESIKMNAFTKAYYLTESGEKINIPNSQMANGEIVFVTSEAGRIVVYQNFTILYIFAGIIVVFVVIFVISRLRKSASVASARDKYQWLK